MDKLVFQEYEENELLSVLEANSDGVEEMHYTEFLTEDELAKVSEVAPSIVQIEK